MARFILSTLAVFIIPCCSLGQTDESIAFDELDKQLEQFLPYNWHSTKSDSSIVIYFARYSKYRNSNKEYHTPDSVCFVNSSESWKSWSGKRKGYEEKDNYKNYKVNGILKIEITINEEDTSLCNNFGYSFNLKSSFEDKFRIHYIDTVNPEKPHYHDRLGSGLEMEYYWLVLTLKLLMGEKPY